MATDLEEPRSVAAAPTVEEKRAALEQVLQSACFLRADQLRSFLRFVCEMEIAGRADQISEYLIGVEALGRASGYSPGEDPVVRRRAVHLRERLDEVYRTDRRDATLRIELPKGRYVPRFVRWEPPTVAVAAAALSPPGLDVPAARAGAARFERRHLVIAFLAGVFAASAAFAVWRQLPASWREHFLEAGVSYEAEATGNILAGMTKSTMDCANCSGGGRVRSIGAGPRNYVEFLRVMARQAGEKELVVHYILHGQRSFFVGVNGEPGVEVPVRAQNWAMPSRVVLKVRLAAGPNTIRFFNDKGYAPDLDRIVVRD